ncbi:MAG: serine--tRNA ligase, partial [Anaerolineae bacterium]
MIDMALIRRDPQTVRDALTARNEDPALVDRVLEIDGRWRALLAQVEELRAERNRVSREIGRMKDPAQREPLIAQMRAVGDRIAELEDQVRTAEVERDGLLLRLPNIPHPSVPVGP